MTTATKNGPAAGNRATPIVNQKAHEIQAFGHLVAMPLALSEKARKQSVDNLNQLLADTMTLRDMYKKHHWQVSGPTFYQLHLLFDKHYGEQSEMVDTIAERIQTLGGLSVAMAHDVAETTTIPRVPKGREEAPVRSPACCRPTRSCCNSATRLPSKRRTPATTAPTTWWLAASFAPMKCRSGS